MKLHISLLFVFVFSLISITGIAQNKSIQEQIQTEKIAFFTEKIGLTLNEAERFWPVYNEYWNKKRKIIEERKKKMNAYLEHPESFSNQELEKLADEYVEYRLQKAKLFENYHQKFKEILPPDKVMRLYMADYDFKSYLLKKIKKQGKND